MSHPPPISRASSTVQLSPGVSVADDLFLMLIAARDLRHCVRRCVPTLATSTADLTELDLAILGSEEYIGSRADVVFEHGPDVICHVELADGSAWIRAVAATSAAARLAADGLCDALYAEEPDDDSQMRITFWSKPGWDSPRQLTRDVAAERWPDVSANYDQATRASIEQLRALDACPEARLILWHGPPGTGKTHALRSLALEWAPWCATYFICDPENLLYDVAGYLIEVTDAPDERSSGLPDRAKLLILEDSGELMSATARNDAGQGLSRLLNLTDGLLGQGLDLIVLITTNEPIGSLHDAVTRPGRCLAEIEFRALPAAEANTWLQEHGCEDRVAAEATLADLYAIKRGEQPRSLGRRPIGFAA